MTTNMDISNYIDSTKYLKLEKELLLECIKKISVTSKYGLTDDTVSRHFCNRFAGSPIRYGESIIRWFTNDGCNYEIITNYGNCVSFAMSIVDDHNVTGREIREYRTGISNYVNMGGKSQLRDGIIDFVKNINSSYMNNIRNILPELMILDELLIMLMHTNVYELTNTIEKMQITIQKLTQQMNEFRIYTKK